jgi:SAM-dependent methyltransferase
MKSMKNPHSEETVRARDLKLKFVRALAGRTLRSDSPLLRQHLAALFDSEGIDLQALAGSAIAALKLHPVVNEMLEDAESLDAAAIRQKLSLPRYMEALDHPLVHRLLRRTIVSDVPFERLLTVLRRAFLLGEVGGKDIRFPVSLACQCFNNEYIYAVGTDEEEELSRLAEKLRGQLRLAARVEAEDLAVFAMYAPLGSLGDSNSPLPEFTADPDFGELFTRQVLEPREEEELRKTIPSFGTSGDTVSEAVRRQYEDSPYPRWLDLTLTPPVRFADKLRERFPFLDRIAISPPVRVLVAGCGTGHHPISIAAKYSDVEVLAIDISKASLACGMRQARRYGLSNVEFLHGDILCLESLGRRFDVVESVGVLHHMADFQAGLKALTSVVVPGGYLKIGVYSRRARAYLREFRPAVARRDVSSAKELRAARQEMIDMLAQQPAAQRSPAALDDFFYLSGFRDLLAHAHEVEFTPAELEPMLKSLNLEFLGYRNLSEEVHAAYAESFPMDPQMRDLALVDRFEADHHDRFPGIQIFWVAKREGSEALVPH